jgi:uncharacterized LabA/DUF88 family protein
MLQVSVSTAILVDNMYLQNAARVFGIEQLDPRKFPKAFLRSPPEEHFRTYIFDALPFVPKFNATSEQLEYRKKKKGYLDAIQYAERISVLLGDVRPKQSTCPKCGNSFIVPVQKRVDVLISVQLVSLAWSEIVKKIVLVAGDKDLLPALEAIEPTGTIVRLAYVEEQYVQTSKALIRAAQEKHKLLKSDIAFCKFEKT